MDYEDEDLSCDECGKKCDVVLSTQKGLWRCEDCFKLHEDVSFEECRITPL